MIAQFPIEVQIDQPWFAWTVVLGSMFLISLPVFFIHLSKGKFNKFDRRFTNTIIFIMSIFLFASIVTGVRGFIGPYPNVANDGPLGSSYSSSLSDTYKWAKENYNVELVQTAKNSNIYSAKNISTGEERNWCSIVIDRRSMVKHGEWYEIFMKPTSATVEANLVCNGVYMVTAKNTI